MTEALFGPPSGFLQRLNRAEVRVPDLREAAARLAEDQVAPGLELAVQGGTGRGPMLVLEEAGRRTRVLLAELAVEMTRAHVPATPDGVATALAAWLARRPVPDGIAATQGIAVVDWTDSTQRTLGWRVVIARDALVVPWRPSGSATLPLVHQTRSAALGRSAALPGQLQVRGPVALWTSTEPAGVDTAVLARPEQLLAEMAGAGLRLRDAHVVVTPRRPVACAEAGVARRLAAETTDAWLSLPWRQLADLGWA
ncbi:hypothetical protein [uncultured Modestobacter sp.]|uniref:hypothetical protein n=1 Tax=uncultured Modestobacter sp. TaxID=380048 RepID=UPI0026204574|nr:hypothetical protein [uncultured Modestobacter sp.]